MAKKKKIARATKSQVTKALAKMSPAEKAARDKRLTYNRWKVSLVKRKLWKKRHEYTHELKALRRGLNGKSETAPVVVAEAPVGDKKTWKEVKKTVARIQRAAEIVSELRALHDKQVALRAEACALLTEE